MQETWIQCLGWEDRLEKAWQPTPVFLPGEFHRHRSLVGYSPWGPKESDTTEQLTFFWPVKSTLAPRPILFLSVVACGLVAKSCLTLATPWTVTYRLFCPRDFPDKNTGVSCHFLLQGIFRTQESCATCGLLPCRQTLYQLSHQGSLYSPVAPWFLNHKTLGLGLEPQPCHGIFPTQCSPLVRDRVRQKSNPQVTSQEDSFSPVLSSAACLSPLRPLCSHK